MNRALDYNGTVVSMSAPVRQLKTVKKTFVIDSADRDTVKYSKNGDFVVYLPRVYENIVSLRLKGGEFPAIYTVSSGAGLLSHPYGSGSVYSSDTAVAANTFYFLIDIEGLNKTDETTIAAVKSTYTDNFYAKIPVSLTMYSGAATPLYSIQYNDSSMPENIAEYSPAISKLDRLHIRIRTHSQQDRSGFSYWTTTGAYDGASANFSLTFEIEYLDNVFDNFSQFETRINTRQ